MDLTNFIRIPISGFKGVFDRGDQDAVPPDHFIDALNLDFFYGGVECRRGAATRFTPSAGKPRNTIREFANTSAAPTIFSIDSDGNIYKDDVLLLNVAGAIEFGAVQFFNKMFISPRDTLDGVGNLLVYDKVTDTFREAGGAAPAAGSAMVAVDGAPGIVPVGTRLIAVIYETNTGFYTRPGPEIATVFTPTSYTGPGGLKINLSNIPTGPAVVIRRYILCTRSDEFEYFFVPDEKGGLIDNNIDTTATLDFFDTDLIESADYLFDVLERIPAGTGMSIYNGKLALWGFPAPDGSLIHVSFAGEPEAFHADEGLVIVSKDDGYRITNGIPIRDVLYIFKEKGIHAVSDNGDIPSNWDTYLVDKAIGTTVKGISTVSPTEETGPHIDVALIADKSGLYMFDGVVRFPDLTWKISKLWEAITLTSADIFIDVVKKCIYITGYNNGILIGSYEEGFEPNKIKWCPWIFSKNVLGGTFLDAATGGNPEFVFNFNDVADLKFYKLVASQRNDLGTTGIRHYLRTALLSKQQDMVSLFGALKLRVSGAKNLKTFMDSLDDSGGDASKRYVMQPLTLVNKPGRDIMRYMQFETEAVSLTLEMNDGKDSWFRASRLTLYQKPRWFARPQ